MLAPATPHIAEELWKLIGQDGLLAQYNIEILTENYGDFEVISKENFLRNVISYM